MEVQRAGAKSMNKNSNIDEIRRALARLEIEHQVLAQSHRRLVSQVFGNTPEAEKFLGQMAVETVKLYPDWLR
jgi:hypothetical protein